MSIERTKANQRPWLTTGKHRDNPQPQMYPQCPECSTPWVYCRFLSLSSGGYVWAWRRDCKHRNATPETVDEREGVNQ